MEFLRRLLRWLLPGQSPPPASASVPPPAPDLPGPASLAATDRPATPPVESDPYFAAAPAPRPAAAADAKATPISKAPGLDAGAFLPITRAEIQEAARGQNLMANVWFGRRDLIPPADDPRTLLIDRALVTHGLLSPEQLAEIHRVGAEHERVQPSLIGIQHRAAQEGEAAVRADREARALLKTQKKAEAAERKRQRAEAVAFRRATDIVFLGRGVSGLLNDRTSDLDALAAAGLPALSTPSELATALGLSISRLRWLAFHAEVATRVHYVRFEVPKRSGGTRALCAPHRTLALVQRWILREIVGRLPVEDVAHGFIAGRSIVTNARPHCGRAVVVNLDLRDFFPSIGFPRVRTVFRRAGYSPAVATILALLCTECPRRTVVYDGTPYHVATGPRGLPQGACTSPGLSNLVARRLDRRFSGLASKLRLTYTRYADDLSFSGGEEALGRIGYLMARVRHIAAAEGFEVNEAKSRVLRRNTAQEVTGLVVNDRPGVCRDEVRRLRAILHRARLEGLDRQNRARRPDFRAWLEGKIAYVAMVRPEVGARLRAEYEALRAG